MIAATDQESGKTGPVNKHLVGHDGTTAGAGGTPSLTPTARAQDRPAGPFGLESTLSTRSTNRTLQMTYTPAIAPMITAPTGSTKAHGVVATTADDKLRCWRGPGPIGHGDLSWRDRSRTGGRPP